MQYVGFFLIVVAAAAILAGILNQMKAKKILAAPFRQTGEIARNPQVADARGTVSCEGAVAAAQPLVAPCSGKPCVYYEVELVRHWEKTVNTEDGQKTEKGTTSISTSKVGSHFQLDDGSGPVGVDARESVDCELEKTFEQMQSVAWGDVIFGQHRAHVPHDGGDHATVGVKCVERILPAQGKLFVLGKLSAGAVTKTDGVLGKLMASTKGREKLLGATKRNALIGFVAGGLSIAGGVPMAILGDPPHDSCAEMRDAWAETCAGRITDDAGNTYDWTVTKAGTYSIEVLQPGVKIPIYPVLTVTSASGAEIARVEAAQSVLLRRAFEPGTYKINVRDSVKGAPAKFKGGFSFSLRFGGGPAGAPSADPSGAASASPAEAAASPKQLGPGVRPASHATQGPSAAASARPSATPTASATPAAASAAAKAPPARAKRK
jgi:hypothetical protein